jgi:hypothetical protein
MLYGTGQYPYAAMLNRITAITAAAAFICFPLFWKRF